MNFFRKLFVREKNNLNQEQKEDIFNPLNVNIDKLIKEKHQNLDKIEDNDYKMFLISQVKAEYKQELSVEPRINILDEHEFEIKKYIKNYRIKIINFIYKNFIIII